MTILYALLLLLVIILFATITTLYDLTIVIHFIWMDNILNIIHLYSYKPIQEKVGFTFHVTSSINHTTDFSV